MPARPTAGGNVRYGCCLLIAAWLALTAGCGQNPYRMPAQGGTWGAPPATAEASQLGDLQRRISELDNNNRDLHTQLAQAQQQAGVYRDQVELLREQLSESAQRLEQSLVSQEETRDEIAALEASMRRRGGATLRANNSLTEPLQVVDLPGFSVRQQDDVIRIEVPSDQLFVPGTLQFRPEAAGMVDRLAAAIALHYPRQRIAIEGHVDNTIPSQSVARSGHELSARQAIAVLERLTVQGRLPARQLFVVAQGANYPRVSNATPAGQARNRRIELVVYPETL